MLKNISNTVFGVLPKIESLVQLKMGALGYLQTWKWMTFLSRYLLQYNSLITI